MIDPDKNRRRRSGGAKPRNAPPNAAPPAPAGRRPGGRPGAGRPGSGRPRSDRPGGPPAQRSGQPRDVPRGQVPPNVVYGFNAVSVALETGQLKVMFFEQGRSNERIQQLHAMAVSQRLEVRPLQKQGWARSLPPDQHQGIAGLLHDAGAHYLEEIVAEGKAESCILVLDRIQDPQNLGAILRTAAASGVDAVVLPKAGGCPLTPAVHKASAGMSLKVRIVEDENLARALEFLKDHGYWVVGCDSGEGEDATFFEFPEKRVIVMGNEAEGARRLVRESCDYMVRIPMAPGVESLNVSVATAIVLYLAKADIARAAEEHAHTGPGHGHPAPGTAQPAAGGPAAAPDAPPPANTPPAASEPEAKLD